MTDKTDPAEVPYPMPAANADGTVTLYPSAYNIDLGTLTRSALDATGDTFRQAVRVVTGGPEVGVQLPAHFARGLASTLAARRVEALEALRSQFPPSALRNTAPAPTPVAAPSADPALEARVGGLPTAHEPAPVSATSPGTGAAPSGLTTSKSISEPTGETASNKASKPTGEPTGDKADAGEPSATSSRRAPRRTKE